MSIQLYSFDVRSKQNSLIHSPSHSDNLTLIKNSIPCSALLCFLNGLNKTEKKPILQLHQKTGISRIRNIVLCRQVFSLWSYTVAVTEIPECQDHKNNDSIHGAPFGTHFLFISSLTACITLSPKESSIVPFPMNINHLGMQKKTPLLWQWLDLSRGERGWISGPL